MRCELCHRETSRRSVIKYHSNRILVCSDCLRPNLPPFKLPPWHQKRNLTRSQDRELRTVLAGFQQWVHLEIEESGSPPDIRTCAYMLGIKGQDGIAGSYRNKAVSFWNTLHPEKRFSMVKVGGYHDRRKQDCAAASDALKALGIVI